MALIIFAWVSYVIISLAACIVIYEFLERRIPVWRKRDDNNGKCS